MLGKYIKINGEQVPNPVDYSESASKVSNTFQSEAGDDLVIDVRTGKHSASLKFQCSSYWKEKLSAYANEPSITLQVDSKTYTSRIADISASLEKNSEREEASQGYWTVSFTAEEL